MSSGLRRILCAAGLSIMYASILFPQEGEPDKNTLIPHSDISRVWLSGQVNIIHQQHPAFFAKYSAENSLRAEREKATSLLLTLYTGVQLTGSTELLLDVESAGGREISDALGLAGFTDLDVVRNPTLGAKPYLARLMFHRIIAIGREKTPAERNYLSLATQKPERRLEIHAGKLGMADFFDLNAVGSDSHLQFMNWTVDNNGGYDYAADTRGYTYAAVFEYQSPGWAARFAEALMPRVANGIQLDWNLRRARAENWEFELRPSLIKERATSLRFLSYINHANMGSYREAINSFLDGREPRPNIEAHRRQGRVKYGFGFNAEQEITDQTRVYGRLGWNEGHNESFAYTEVNGSVALGADVKGKRWRRPKDKAGVTWVGNSISGDHRRYLQLGGRGFLLGDGTLTYRTEKILESYYTAHVMRGVAASLDFQYIANPGYNHDRGPVVVPGLRLHVDF